MKISPRGFPALCAAFPVWDFVCFRVSCFFSSKECCGKVLLLAFCIMVVSSRSSGVMDNVVEILWTMVDPC